MTYTVRAGRDIMINGRAYRAGDRVTMADQALATDLVAAGVFESNDPKPEPRPARKPKNEAEE